MQKIAVLSVDDELTDRVSRAMERVATCVQVDPTSANAPTIVEHLAPDMLVIEATTSYPGASSGVFERIAMLRERYPETPIIGLGDELAAQTVLLVMRAGANDMIERDSSIDELRAQLSAHLKQKLRKRNSTVSASLTLVMSGRPDENETHVAVNLAVQKAMAAKGRHEVLLVDVGLPSSEAAICLDLAPTYTFREALDDLLRMDKTLVTSALARHEASGLYLLPLSTGAEDVGDLRPADILSIIFMLRGMFDEIVVNVGHLRHSRLLPQLVEPAAAVLVVTSQHFASIKACSDLSKSRQLDQLIDERFQLLIADYDQRIEIRAERIAAVLGIARVLLLPPARTELVNCFNSGRPLALERPDAPYCRALAGAGAAEAKPRERRTGVSRLLAKVGLV